MAIIDVIRFDGLKSRDWLIYKAPVEDIVTGGQLIVQEGQRAIFVKHGMVADTFGPGTYQLTTENLPILRRLVEIPFGGNTPFSAEVYFINTVVRLDIYWGLTDPIQLIDPKYHIKLRLRAFGQMNLAVTDGDFVFKNVIGGMQKAEIVNFDKVKSYFRGMIVNKVKALLSETIINDGVSALEISAKIETLSDQVQVKIEPLLNEYGFKCAHFYIQSINFPDEDFASINKILEDKAAFEIMGESRYASKRTFDVYESAASNSNGVSGTFAAMGVSAGVGMNMGTAMRSGQSPIAEANLDYKECYACHAKIPATSRFCPACGVSIEQQFCSECGEKIAPGNKFCPNCGAKVGQ